MENEPSLQNRKGVPLRECYGIMSDIRWSYKGSTGGHRIRVQESRHDNATSKGGKAMMSKSVTCMTFAMTFAFCGCGTIHSGSYNASDEISRWGDQELYKDVEFAKLFLNSSNDAAAWHITATDFDALVKRCRDNPRCTRSIFIAFRSLHQQNPGSPKSSDSDEAWFIDRISRSSSRYSLRPHKAVLLLLFASMCNKSEWIYGLSWENVNERWDSASEWIHEYRFVLMYDCEKQVFSIDMKAYESNLRVPPRMQMWTRCQDLSVPVGQASPDRLDEGGPP